MDKPSEARLELWRKMAAVSLSARTLLEYAEGLERELEEMRQEREVLRQQRSGSVEQFKQTLISLLQSNSLENAVVD